MNGFSRDLIQSVKRENSGISLCFHCGLSTNNPISIHKDEEKSFCCHGCLTVFQIIEESKLDQYYSIKKESDPTLFIPATESIKNFKYFDDPSFHSEYIKEKDGEKSIKLYLEGVHCIACLWLIEKIPQILKGVVKAQFDFDNSVAHISVRPGLPLSEVAKLLDKLGYPPHPIKNEDEVSKLKANEERSYLIRLGIAMACMGNILLFSISIYAGLEGGLKQTFNWLSFIISLPVVSYCALPFYRGALSTLRQKKLNMDLPISVALIAGTASGLLSLITGIGETYFDSLTSLVFLLLLSRYCLLKIRQRGVTSSNLEYFSSFGNVCVLNNLTDKKKNFILAKYVQKGDLVLIKESEMIPADGEILEGSAFLNTSLLTGESLPIKTGPAKPVFSGTVVSSGEVIMRVTFTGTQTKLGKILSNVKLSQTKQSPFATLSERVSRYFVFLVFLISIATIINFWLQGMTIVGINRALTLLIVTCPCALALATPLALTAAIQKLLKKGIILKSEDVVEKMSNAKNIYLDKTGTLTEGNFQVLSWTKLTDMDFIDIVWTLEKRASHPIASALKSFIEKSFHPIEIEMDDWLETPGFGVQAQIKGEHYSINRSPSYSGVGTSISLFKNKSPVLNIILKDKARPDTKQIIANLKEKGLRPIILSGDSRSVVDDLANEVGVDLIEAHSEISPEGKLELLTKDQSSIMVGDGANDAMALSKASIGIAVKGSLDISLEAADIYFTKTGISSLNHLIRTSRTAIRVIKINMVFSLLFNLAGGYLALSGIITPLIAAVLMPLSSLSVLLSTYLFSKEEV